MKKRNIILIIIAIFAFLLLLIGITVLAMNANNDKKVEKRIKPDYQEEQTITCTREKAHDDIDEEETVYLQKGILITRTNTATWNKTAPSEKTCDYYMDKSKGLNEKKGITSTVNCSDTRGTFTVTYTIADMDREDTRLKQFDYLDSKNVFDYRGWIQYMKKDGYTCNK